MSLTKKLLMPTALFTLLSCCPPSRSATPPSCSTVQTGLHAQTDQVREVERFKEPRRKEVAAGVVERLVEAVPAPRVVAGEVLSEWWSGIRIEGSLFPGPQHYRGWSTSYELKDMRLTSPLEYRFAVGEQKELKGGTSRGEIYTFVCTGGGIPDLDATISPGYRVVVRLPSDANGNAGIKLPGCLGDIVSVNGYAVAEGTIRPSGPW